MWISGKSTIWLRMIIPITIILDPVVEVEQCAQYVDDIGTAVNDTTNLTWKFGELLSELAKRDCN